MRYRYSLGYKKNVQTDLQFPFRFGWHLGGDTFWSGAIGSSIFHYTGPNSGYLLNDQAAFFVNNTLYRVEITFSKLDNAVVRVGFGQYLTPGHTSICNVLQYTFDCYFLGDAIVVGGNSGYLTLFFDSIGGGVVDVEISNIYIYTLEWNDPLIKQPSGETKTGIKQSSFKNGVVVSYMDNITFIDDGFDYLYQKVIANNLDIVPCRVEVDTTGTINTDPGTWEDFYVGQIYLTDCDWKRNEVSCSIEDNAISRALQGNIDNVYSNSYNTDIARYNVYLHDSLGAYYANPAPIFNLGEMFKFMVAMATDCNATFESEALGMGIISALSVWQYLGISLGMDINNTTFPAITPIETSFGKLLEGINQIFPVGIRGIVDANGVPAIKLEPLNLMRDTSTSITLTNVIDEPYKFTKKENYKTIKSGFRITDLHPDIDSSEYFLATVINAEAQLDISTDIIQDSVATLNMVMDASPTTNKYEGKLFFIRYELIAGSYYSIQNGSFEYNYDIISTDNFTRWMLVLKNQYIRQSDSVLFPVDPTTKQLIKDLETNIPLSYANLKLLKANPLQQIIITGQINSVEAYLEDFEWNNITQMAKFKVVAT